PRSNTRLQCGRLRWPAYREAGVRLALGTDSLASSPSLSIWDEAANAYALHAQDIEPPDPHELLRVATLVGAEALGWGDELGPLAPGKCAKVECARRTDLNVSVRDAAAAVLEALLGGVLSVCRVEL